MLAVVLKSEADFLKAYIIKKDAVLLFHINNLKVDMLKKFAQH